MKEERQWKEMEWEDAGQKHTAYPIQSNPIQSNHTPIRLHTRGSESLFYSRMATC